MYELIIDNNGVEYVAFSAEREREVELMRQRHLRSLTDGTAIIRKVEKKAEK
ncbi:MAG: hypothetical protein JEY79_09930 [Pseudodesulfovibrio sp.]|nr:hypothetical protein [Pseudodesulfovibrio sp.]